MVDSPLAQHFVYRLDTFIVPASARTEFIAQIAAIHEQLRTIDGYIQDAILEKPLTEDSVQIVTMVQWRDQDAVSNARSSMSEVHRQQNFNAQEFMTRLGVRADMSTYRSLVG